MKNNKIKAHWVLVINNKISKKIKGKNVENYFQDENNIIVQYRSQRI